jgi:hypothetical protein
MSENKGRSVCRKRGLSLFYFVPVLLLFYSLFYSVCPCFTLSVPVLLSVLLLFYSSLFYCRAVTGHRATLLRRQA